MVRQAGVLAVLFVLVLVVPAAGTTKPTAELKGCRLLAAAYNASVKGTANKRVALVTKALNKFHNTRDGDLLSIVIRPVSPTFSSDLGAWCTADYPKDHAVRDAEFPRPLTS